MTDDRGQTDRHKPPTFLVVGVAKAGTTSLWAYLRQHPQVCMSSLKETNYFAYEGEDTLTFLGEVPGNKFLVRTYDQYLELFRNAGDALAVGEASPLYFESPVAAARIQSELPDVRIIVNLRNPVDRAISDYQMILGDEEAHLWRPRPGQSSQELEQALEEDQHIVQIGLYYDKLKRYFDRFPREHIKVTLFEDLREDSLAFIQGIYRYIGVASDFEPDLAYDPGRAPESTVLRRLFTKVGEYPFLKRIAPASAVDAFRAARSRYLDRRIEVPPDLRRKTMDLYREDIRRVEDLVELDLSHWLET